LAAATAISAFINAGQLYRGLRRDGVFLPEPGWWLLFLRVVLANTLMGLVLWFGAGDLEHWFGMRAWHRAGELFMWIGIGIVVYFATLFATGVRAGDLIARKTERR
jgi:putative peptidoglycan lipid II flippase